MPLGLPAPATAAFAVRLQGHRLLRSMQTQPRVSHTPHFLIS